MRLADGVATIELNRPEALNAWNTRLGLDLLAGLRRVAADDAVRAVVITGAGRAFSSGADLKDSSGGETTPNGRPDVYKTLTERYHPIMHAIREMGKPVIASVNGPAVGIGCSLALCCDLIVAAQSAYFLLAFVNIGLVPDGGSSLFVPTRIGMARATELAMLGERLGAAQALEWGLINRVVADEGLQEETATLAARLAGGPTRSYAGTKRQLNNWLYARMEEQLELEAHIQQEMAGSATISSRAPTRIRRASVRKSALLGELDPTPRSWQTSSSASRPGLNRIPAALGHLLSRLLALNARVLHARSPAGHSRTRTRSTTLYKITLYVGLVIFVLVEGALLYALVKFRARKGAVPAQIRGNTRLEVGWTVAAAVILVGLAVLTFAKLASIQDPSNSGPNGDQSVGESGLLYASADRRLPPNGKSLNITVIGRQYIWQYVYPGASEPDGLGAPYSYQEMVVPTNTTVTLNIVSADVVHSWWIPELGGKFQAVPGYHNYAWFKISTPGVYRGQCAALCGRGHARMIASVKAVPPAQFEAWLAYQKKLIAEANADAKVARAKLNSQTGAGQVENP